MKTVKLMLDYLQGPIWISDAETGEPMTGIAVIDTDQELRKLNYECCDLYSCCYEFDSHDRACWFNEEQFEKSKERIQYLLDAIKKRLDVINDGSYVVEDDTKLCEALNIEEAKTVAWVAIANLMGVQYFRDHFAGSYGLYPTEENDDAEYKFFMGFEGDANTNLWTVFARVSVNRKNGEIKYLDYRTPDGRRMENPIKPTDLA